MTAEPGTPPLRKSEIIIWSDWLTTAGAVLGFGGCLFLLISSMRHLVWGQLVPPRPVRQDLFGILNQVYGVVACILAFVLAFEFREKSLKAACFLAGLSLVASSLLSFFHPSPRIFRTMAIARSVMWQFALVLFLLAIGRWFRSVVRRAPAEQARGAT